MIVRQKLDVGIVSEIGNKTTYSSNFLNAIINYANKLDSFTSMTLA